MGVQVGEHDDVTTRYVITPSTAHPPWSDVPPEVAATLDLDRVRTAFRGRPAPRHVPRRHLRPAAVLVLFVPRIGSTRVVLVKRSTQFGSHRGDIAFPGGTLDAGETASAAAVREAWEELGIPAEFVEVVGELTPVSAIRTGFLITPVVGVATEAPTYVPSPNEVDAVFEIDVADLLDRIHYREEIWTDHRGSGSTVSFFDLSIGTVWGATASILVELLTVLTCN